MQSSERKPLPLARPDFRYREIRRQVLANPQDNAPVQTASQSTIEIQVEKKEVRPFELGDLLSRKWVSRNSSFLVSFAFHLLVLLALSAFLVSVGGGKAMILLDLMTSPDIEERQGLIADFDMESELDDEFDALNEEAFESEFGNLGEWEGQATNANGDRSAKDGTRVGKKAGDGKSAKFFGTRAKGKKFVYLMDSSGSMGAHNAKGSPIHRFDVARSELLDSIDSLQPDQQFYVVLFSHETRRMLDDEDMLAKPLNATPENKKRVRKWLKSVIAIGGTDPRESLKLAIKLNPDAVFMLSDGQFRDESDGDPKSIEIVRQHAQANSPIQINSIAFEDQSSRKNMQELSDVSGGQFRFVEVNDVVEDLLDVGDEASRIKAVEHLSIHAGEQWEQQNRLANYLAPMLKSESLEIRTQAETLLHELSLGSMEDEIKSVAHGNATQKEKNAAVGQWQKAWQTADLQAKFDLPNDLSYFVSKAREKGGHFIKSINEMDVTTLLPNKQISFARRVLKFQDKNGVTDESKQAFLSLILDLNRNSPTKFSETFFLRKADQETCKQRLAKTLENRERSARACLRKWEDESLAIEVRNKKAKELLEVYPETKTAQEMHKEMDTSVILSD